METKFSVGEGTDGVPRGLPQTLGCDTGGVLSPPMVSFPAVFLYSEVRCFLLFLLFFASFFSLVSRVYRGHQDSESCFKGRIV